MQPYGLTSSLCGGYVTVMEREDPTLPSRPGLRLL